MVEITPYFLQRVRAIAIDAEANRGSARPTLP